MSKLLTYQRRSYRYDPTKTLTLRNAFTREITRRVKRIRQEIRKIVFDEIGSGVGEEWMEGLQERIQNIVDKHFGGDWEKRYLGKAYSKGIKRGRQELRAKGYDVPAINELEEQEIKQAIEVYMSSAHRTRAAFVRERFEGLKERFGREGATEISEKVAEGMMQGKHPREIADLIDPPLNKTRYQTQTAARTEVIRAHHKATVKEYKEWEAHGVYVQGEFRTAGDDRVCLKCEQLEFDTAGNRKVYSLDEIEGMIPVHDNCRCIALPVEA